MLQKILIIDDSEDIHELVRLHLHSESAEIYGAESGLDGIRLAEQHLPDLILLDVDMPQPDGFEVCRQLKSKPATNEIPIVFLTGASSTDQKLRGLELGAVDYIVKPFDPAELLARVKTSLKTKRLLDSLQESEGRFRFLAENSSDMISRHDLRGQCLYVSPASRTMLGYDPAEIVGRNLLELACDEERQGLEDVFGGRADERTAAFTFRARHKNGKSIWLDSTARVVRLPDAGGTFEVHLSTRDVTQRKQAESLEQSRALILQMIAESQPLPFILAAVVEMVEQEYPSAYASALLLAEGRLDHTAPHLPAPFKEAMDQVILRFASSMASDVLVESQRVACTYLAEAPQWEPLRAEAAQVGLTTCWMTSLRSSDGEVLGLLSLYHRERRAPDRFAEALLQTGAKLLTIAIERQMLTHQLAYRAQHDSLTGLPNRFLFDDRLTQALLRAERSGQTMALLCMDLDRFKVINDTLGHHAGDMLLVEFSRRLQCHVRQSDTLARMGGDEFALIATELSDPRAATVIAQKLLDAFSTPFRIAGHELFVTGSIGIAYYPKDAPDASSLQKNADLALYRAKAMGRNRHECFSADMLTATGERLALDNALRRALTADEMRLYYQPQFDAHDQLVGLESLVRWEHPILGLLPPAKFISLSEETGFILHIGEWVLNEACRQSKAWQDAGFSRIRVGVNVSALQLAQSEFVNSVESALKRHNLPAEWLEIEITESLLMRNPRETAAKLEQISGLGVGVALDDFGTGYSSLAYLQHLPIHKLKIDRSFVRQLGGAANPANNMAVIRAIISLGNSLGMNVIAEGVETEQQRDQLRRAGCGMMQGFLYGQPQPGVEIEHVLRKAMKAAA